MATVATVTTATPSPRVADRGSLQAERLFYVIAAYLMLVATLCTPLARRADANVSPAYPRYSLPSKV